jgi:uncharacterized protein YebE (UPF0316 family)
VDFFGLTTGTILIGIFIFLARVVDVSLGTLRTISIVHGRTKVAFLVGFVEISIWLTVISTTVQKIADAPLLGIFYALGFSTGSVVGIRLERWLALGDIVLRVISPKKGRVMAEIIRSSGFAVTTFQGEGKSGSVTELYIVCHRKDLSRIMPVVRDIEPDAFYITEPAGSVSKVFRPMYQPTGWRAVFKRK